MNQEPLAGTLWLDSYNDLILVISKGRTSEYPDGSEHQFYWTIAVTTSGKFKVRELNESWFSFSVAGVGKTVKLA